jgi:arginyl-tRNA--protein-N-Asp/Glu arginylyltransferase
MISLVTFTTPPHPCAYFPDRVAKTDYEYVAALSADEFQGRLDAGWRKFGHTLFRPSCPACRACQSIRVPVATFRPDRSQKRAWAANRGVTLTVAEPAVTAEKVALYDAFHAYQSTGKGWPAHDPESPESYAESFVSNPVAVEEWQYRIGTELVGVGYVDRTQGGLSAVYFVYSPAHRHRSLGTFNVLSVLAAARAAGLPQVYLGYFVDGYASLEYKARFRPNDVLEDGRWRAYREGS